ncbi:MAG TPA: methionyl-tRNA formyltransferase [Coriobacteriia bacterium]|nr:MAG: Methionyl-tRNA formyltransferase [Actinobacteria bacterium 66_15]HAL29099.1 methionyl-tRNA formyltransferase [Coriobacteriia bacterium]
MRIVFMGTPAFAVPTLDMLAQRHDVALVVTQPDRVSGRGVHSRHSPVKERALEIGLPVLQPARLDDDAVSAIRDASPEAICVAAFGMLLPPSVLSVPPLGCLNVHASLLPAYRGAAPIQRAILSGDRETGVSIMLMEEGLDTGPYALQRMLPIEGLYADEVELRLAGLGADALAEVLAGLPDSVTWTPQDAGEATYAAKITKDDVALDPELHVDEAFRRVRAATRRAPARACLGDREVTVKRATPVEADVAPGGLCLADGYPVLGFSGGALRLDVLRPAGKGDMSGRDWARGARLAADVCWRCTR